MRINCRGKLLDLSSTKIMGILNYTPDSFFDGGRNNNPQQALKQVEKMLLEGADIIDIGAYSSRPYSNHISIEEELDRIIPILKLIRTSFPEAVISVDTFRSEVARTCLDYQADMINDISGGNMDAEMLSLIGQYKVPYIAMHIKGTPQTMQNKVSYKNVVIEIKKYFSEKIFHLLSLGVNDILLDPGFGFGKNIRHNYEILKLLNLFQSFRRPIVVGLSRKSMIYKVLKNSPEESLNGTTALHAIAMLKGVNILRVHDVREAKEVVELVRELLNF